MSTTHLVFAASVTLTTLGGLASSPPAAAGQPATEPHARISSRVETTPAGELTLVETVDIEAPVSAVWEAYTTSKGFSSWAAPVAVVDLRAGGTIRTHYDPNARIGDPQTNTLRVVNYVPRRMLTLKADIAENWPAVLAAQAEHLYNVILFEAVADDRTRLVSYGLGYLDNPEMRELMTFFITANAQLYEQLIAALEGP